MQDIEPLVKILSSQSAIFLYAHIDLASYKAFRINDKLYPRNLLDAHSEVVDDYFYRGPTHEQTDITKIIQVSRPLNKTGPKTFPTETISLIQITFIP